MIVGKQTHCKIIGNEVVIVKNGHRICGTGAALANTPIQVSSLRLIRFGN